MTKQASGAVERRVAPRFETNFTAELASGTVLVSVTVRDLSIAGCGIFILSTDADLPDHLDARGLLNLPAVDRSTFGTILPVALRNVRTDAGALVYGLEFGPLLAHQARKLHEVIEAMGC